MLEEVTVISALTQYLLKPFEQDRKPHSPSEGGAVWWGSWRGETERRCTGREKDEQEEE